jgi:hypothetical protein
MIDSGVKPHSPMKHIAYWCLSLTLFGSSTMTAQIGIQAGGTTRTFATPPGGPGSSYNKAIVIHGSKSDSGVRSEYGYLAAHFPGSKALNHSREYYTKRTYDVLTFVTHDGQKRALYFEYQYSSQ